MIYKIKTIKIEYKIKESEKTKNELVNNVLNAAKLLREIYKDLDVDQEHFALLALNNQNRITGYKIIASGGQCSARIDPKIVFRNALLLGATGIIIAHNHPSGNATPSQSDIDLTKDLKECARLLNLPILDHIIFTETEEYSFATYSPLFNGA